MQQNDNWYIANKWAGEEIVKIWQHLSPRSSSYRDHLVDNDGGELEITFMKSLITCQSLIETRKCRCNEEEEALRVKSIVEQMNLSGDRCRLMSTCTLSTDLQRTLIINHNSYLFSQPSYQWVNQNIDELQLNNHPSITHSPRLCGKPPSAPKQMDFLKRASLPRSAPMKFKLLLPTDPLVAKEKRISKWTGFFSV